jgi:hypothetical protein
MLWQAETCRDKQTVDTSSSNYFSPVCDISSYRVKADIVVRNRGYWDLYEGKSSTSVKEHYWDDVAVPAPHRRRRGEEPKHFEYLAQPGPDPRKEIASMLLGKKFQLFPITPVH